MKVNKYVVTNYVFIVSEFSLKTKLKDNEEESLGDLILDINFDLLHHKEKGSQRRIDLLFDFKPDSSKPGYFIKGKAEGFFWFQDEIVQDEEKLSGHVLYTCLPMLIASVRSYIDNITASAPFGRYVLPGIPVHELIEGKSKEIEAESDDTLPF